jgi:hypothetical protein
MSVFANAMIGISQSVSSNVVDRAVEAWAQLTDGQQAATGVYFQQSAALRDLVSDFDGSAIAAQNLNSALSANQQMAYQLATAILQTSDQIQGLTDDSAKFIRQSVLSQSELREAREAESQSILSQLQQGAFSDPNELRGAFEEFRQLNTQIFQSLDNATADTANVYATRIEEANTLFQDQLSASLGSVRQDQEAINAEIRNTVLDGAQQLNDAAGRFSASAATFGAWVQTLVEQGISVRVDGGGGEITV